MVSHRRASSSRIVIETGRSYSWRLGGSPSARNDPAIGIVMLEVLPARDPSEDHPLGDPPLVRSDGEVDVRDHETDQRYTGQPVGDVHESPRRVGEHIRIAREEGRAHP